MSENYNERRATMLLLAYWERLRGKRPFPAENDIDPAAIAGLWDHCFLIQARDVENVEDYNFTYLGNAILKAYQGEIERDVEVPIVSPNALDLAAHFRNVLRTGQPQMQEGEFRNRGNATVKYRQILLPLGKGKKVDAILGLMGFRIFPAY